MISRLTLTNFRNHETLRIDAGGRNVVLSGPNGAGKTNVLEAASLLSGTPGFRRAQSEDLARFAAPGYAVAAELESGGEISVYWDEGMKRRKAKINGEAAALGDLAKHISVVWLTPETDLLFVGAPSPRRAFFDNLAAGTNDAHLGRTQRLNKLLSERAFALKNGRNDAWLSLLENNIASAAAAVADARVRFVAELNHFLSAGEIGISGLLEQRIINGDKAGDFEEFYRKYLAENRTLVADRQTVDGAHRTDFSARDLGLGLPADKISSGQQKLLLNRLIIASAKLMSARNPDKKLVILLDEADSHLDARARGELFAELAAVGAQVWMTGVDAAAFADMPDSIAVRLGA